MKQFSRMLIDKRCFIGWSLVAVTLILGGCGRADQEVYRNSRSHAPIGGQDADAVKNGGGGETGVTPTPTAFVTPTPEIPATLNDALAFVSETRLTDNLMFLAGPGLEGRKPGTPGSQKAREFIAAEMGKAGVEPGFSGLWFQPFTIKSARSGGDVPERLTANNVIGVLPGQDPALRSQVIVVGAHYDHLGKASNGQIYPGADDNGSGTDTLVEVARAAGLLKKSFRRTIVFAAFDAEEKGMLGSEHYVTNPVFPIKDTVYMINLDMVGYLKKKGKILALGGLSSTSAAAMIREIAPKYPSMGTPYLTSDAGGGSDHVAFAGDGVPVVFFHTGTDVSPYHQTSDTPDKVDYKGVTDVSKVVLELVWKIAQADAAPSRDRLFEVGHVSPEWSLDHGVAPFMK